VIVQRGIERGELPKTTDARLMLEALIAPLHLRTLLTRVALEDDLPERLVDLICYGMTRTAECPTGVKPHAARGELAHRSP
jgi:hypothetical protein